MQEQSNPATTIKASDPWQRFLDGRAEFKMHAPSVTIRPSMMAAALSYAARGWHVFPAPAGEKKSHKKAEYSGGVNWGMTINPKTIYKDFRKWPDANVAIVTGIESGIFVIEADTAAGHDVDGLASIRELEAKHGPLPDTLMAVSPSGSVHRYYNHPGNGIKIWNSDSEFAPGVDVRGDGGMVIAPPSIKPNVGIYKWINEGHAIADAPAWLIGAARISAAERRAKADGQEDRSENNFERFADADKTDSDLEADPRLIASALANIPNSDVNWEVWNRVAMAAFRATNGSPIAFAAFDAWSRKSGKYDPDGTWTKWNALRTCPPISIGAGTIFHMAAEARRGTDDSGHDFNSAQRQFDREDQDAKANAKPKDEIEFLDMTDWDEVAPPPRLWAVRDRIPLRQPCLLSGEGGVGKTILILQLCTAAALGRDWIGSMPEEGPVIYLGAEDDGNELHRRLADIVHHYKGATFAELKDRLFVTSYAGKDAALARFDRHGRMEVTPLYQQLHKLACAIRPRIIGLDTVSDIFAGNENDRTQVSAFIGLLRGLAMASDSAVIINGHPSLTGISSGSGLSGTTAWHNRVRSRMYFKPAATNDKGDDTDPELRVLEFRKSNYGPIGESILLRWRSGVFVPEQSAVPGSAEKHLADKRIDDLFMGLLARFSHEGRSVSDKPSSSYAPTVFAAEPEAKAAKANKKTLAEAMSRLFVAGKIRVAPEGPPSRQRSRLMIIGGVS